LVDQYFKEGITILIIKYITNMANNEGYVQRDNFKKEKKNKISTIKNMEGWGLVNDGTPFIHD
jgi:hypothetical protein